MSRPLGGLIFHCDEHRQGDEERDGPKLRCNAATKLSQSTLRLARLAFRPDRLGMNLPKGTEVGSLRE